MDATIKTPIGIKNARESFPLKESQFNMSVLKEIKMRREKREVATTPIIHTISSSVVLI